MSLSVIGQRCMSERESELGLGVVANVDKAAKRIGVNFLRPVSNASTRSARPC